MKNFLPLLFIPLFLFLDACTSGKAAFERGDYDEAVLKSVNRLRRNPRHEKSQMTLQQGYPVTKDWHLDNINNLTISNDIYKWEKIHHEYKKLNLLYSEINKCPGCLRVIPTPTSFFEEERETALKAAEVRYALGEKTLSEAIPVRDREKAKQAYRHFETANYLQPGYKDVVNNMEEAKFHATLKIIIDPVLVHSRALDVSAEFFNNKIHDFLLSMPVSEFVRFYTPDEAKAVNLSDPDHVIFLRFDDFVVGQVYHKENVIDCRRDSVVIGTVDVPVSTTDAKGVTTTKNVKKDVYGTVTAKLFVHRKEITSQGLLDFQIMDPVTSKVFTQEKFPGQFVWFTEWGHFNGDERALTNAQFQITQTKEAYPPSPQDLFIAFTQPIFDQVTGKIRAFYSGYN